MVLKSLGANVLLWTAVCAAIFTPISAPGTRTWGNETSTFTVPVFVKLHKVGSTTIFELFECLYHITDVLPPLSDVFLTDSHPGGVTVCHAALHRPWMHETQTFFRLARAEGVAHCFDTAAAAVGMTARVMPSANASELVSAAQLVLVEPAEATPRGRRPPSPPPRIGTPVAVTLVLLRRPLERVVSALMFFHPKNARSGGTKDDDGHRGLDKDKAHKPWRPPRLREADDAARACAALWPDTFDSRVAQHTGTLYEYSDTLGAAVRWREGAPGARARPEARVVAAANASLGRDFDVVGATEDMDGFKALAALALGWPARWMCNSAALRNAYARTADDLGVGARRYLNDLLAPEAAIYEHALAVHARQRAAHGAAFATVLATVRGDECADAAAARAARATRLLARKQLTDGKIETSPYLARCLRSGPVGQSEAMRQQAIDADIQRLRTGIADDDPFAPVPG